MQFDIINSGSISFVGTNDMEFKGTEGNYCIFESNIVPKDEVWFYDKNGNLLSKLVNIKEAKDAI